MTRLQQLLNEALSELNRDDDPMLWADLNVGMATSLVESVGGKYTPELLRQVRAAYEDALTVYTPEETPAMWGETQRNLGAAHGERCGVGSATHGRTSTPRLRRMSARPKSLPKDITREFG